MEPLSHEQWCQLIVERNAWIAHNFPDSPWEETMIGVMEEAGELAHSHLKGAQNIRGPLEEHELKGMDAIGDLTVYLLGVMNHLNYAPGNITIIDDFMLADANTLLLRIGSATGRLFHRPTPDRVDHVIRSCMWYCSKRDWDYKKIVIETWEAVSKRDWIADPLKGGEDDGLYESAGEV
jgi:hypothetical protein